MFESYHLWQSVLLQRTSPQPQRVGFLFARVARADRLEHCSTLSTIWSILLALLMLVASNLAVIWILFFRGCTNPLTCISELFLRPVFYIRHDESMKKLAICTVRPDRKYTLHTFRIRFWILYRSAFLRFGFCLKVSFKLACPWNTLGHAGGSVSWKSKVGELLKKVGPLEIMI